MSVRQHRIESENAANAVSVVSGGIEMEELGRSGVGGGSAAATVMDAFDPANEGDFGGAVRVVLDPFDDAERRSGIPFVIDGSLQALGSAAAVEGRYAPRRVATGGLAGSEGELPQCSLHARHFFFFQLRVRQSRFLLLHSFLQVSVTIILITTYIYIFNLCIFIYVLL